MPRVKTTRRPDRIALCGGPRALPSVAPCAFHHVDRLAQGNVAPAVDRAVFLSDGDPRCVGRTRQLQKPGSIRVDNLLPQLTGLRGRDPCGQAVGITTASATAGTLRGRSRQRSETLPSHPINHSDLLRPSEPIKTHQGFRYRPHPCSRAPNPQCSQPARDHIVRVLQGSRRVRCHSCTFGSYRLCPPIRSGSKALDTVAPASNRRLDLQSRARSADPTAGRAQSGGRCLPDARSTPSGVRLLWVPRSVRQ